MNMLKKLFANWTILKVLRGLACVLFSLYLTAYVDLYILNSIWSRLFIFGCFFIICETVLYAASRLFRFDLSPKIVLPAIAAAILILTRYWSVFFPSTQEIFITLVSETAGEICLCDVVVDGENIPVAQAEVVENSGWLYREKYDNFMIWPEEDGIENRLTLHFWGNEVRLGFPYTPYAGSVTITSSVGYVGTWDLRCPEWTEGEAVEYADFTIDCRRVYSPLEFLLYSAGILLFISFFCLLILRGVGLVWYESKIRVDFFQFFEDKGNLAKRNQGKLIKRLFWPDSGIQSLPSFFWSRKPSKRLCFLIILLGMHCVLFFVVIYSTLDKLMARFIAVLIVASYLCLSSKQVQRILGKNRNPKKIVIDVTLTLCTFFVLVKQLLFLEGNNRRYLSMERVFFLLLVMCCFISVTYLLISFLCSLFFRVANLAWQKSQIRAEILLFLENKQRSDRKEVSIWGEFSLMSKLTQLSKFFSLEKPSLGKIMRNILTFFQFPKPSRKFAFLIIMLGMYCVLFFTSPQIKPDKFTTIFLAVFNIISYLCLTSKLAHFLLKKYITPGKVFVVVIIALYAAFASFGQRFFLDGNSRMHLSVEGLFYLLLGMVWFIPVIYFLLFGLECLSSNRKSKCKPTYHCLAFWMLFAIMCLCQTIILWGVWPGGFATDSIDLLKQATGLYNITTWHPPLNAILYRMILAVCPHAGALVAVQLFFFALLCTKFLILGYDYGISFKSSAVLGVIFGLLPNQVVSGICPIKDYPYTLALLWGTYLLIRLALNPKELWKWRFFLAILVDMFLIYGLRYNGIVPFVALLLLFVWITFRYFSKVRFRLMVLSLTCILMISTYKGPIFSLLHVSQDITMSPYTTMLCAVASCINKGLPLSEESNAIMKSVLPLNQWGTYYNRYLGHDLYYWGRGNLTDKYSFDPSQITAKEAFTVYLEALRKYPDVVIKDRLDGLDLLWDVRQPSDAFNTKGFLDLTILEDDHLEAYFDFEKIEYGVPYYKHSYLAEIYHSTVNTSTNNVMDMLLWRSGAYIILLMTLGVFWWGNRIKCLLWAAVPLLGQIVGLVLVMYHQSFRYIYGVQTLTVALVFCSIFWRNMSDSG